MEGLGPWPPLIGGAGVFFWLIRLALNYQSTISERYRNEITRLDDELKTARLVIAELRARVEVLENNQNELRYLRTAARRAGIFNPWAPEEPVDGTGSLP